MQEMQREQGDILIQVNLYTNTMLWPVTQISFNLILNSVAIIII